MTLAGSTVTIVLGTASNHIRRDTSAQNMVWWTYHGNAGESGLPDSELLSLVLGSSKPLSTPIRDR